MQESVKFKIIHIEEAYSAFPDDPLPEGWAENYLKTRPRVLIDIDIFCKNIRSKKQKMKDFNLFEKTETDGPEVVYVFSIYLELFEFLGKTGHILRVVDFFSKKYKDNLVIFQWNHDQDYSKYGAEIENYTNVKIVNFGYTSKRFSNSITVPFWNYNTKKHKEEKKNFASFYGSTNNQLRQTLVNSIGFRVEKDFIHSNNIPKQRYYKKISESIFSLCPRGGPCDGGFSYRFFECMHLNTIPVLFVDKLVFPYQSELDWDKLCIRLPEAMVNDLSAIKRELEAKTPDVESMLDYIESHRSYFSLLGVQREIFKEIKKYDKNAPK